jgi:hypothetical protein
MLITLEQVAKLGGDGVDGNNREKVLAKWRQWLKRRHVKPVGSTTSTTTGRTMHTWNENEVRAELKIVKPIGLAAASKETRRAVHEASARAKGYIAN